MKLIRRLIVGSPLEQPARRLLRWTKTTRSSSASAAQLRTVRDDAYTRILLRSTLKHDSNCIDVGAHTGQFLVQFLEFAPEGRHWAFEPIPELAEGLQRQFPNVQVLHCALSDHEGEATFHYVPEAPAWSGFRPQPYPRAARPREIQVPVRRLDDVIGDNIQIAFIKIDVEGAELEVFRAAEKLLRRCRPAVLFECGKVHHTHYETTPGEVHSFLESCGLGVYLMDQTGPLTVRGFTEAYESSFRSGYDRHAWGNYLALPTPPASPAS